MRTQFPCELKLERYEILSELGRGSMGIVYKARDLKFDRLVAIKTLSLFGQLSDSEYRERFLREAIAAGRLSHPAIVTVFDFGEDPQNQIPYIVMEYVSGRTLEEHISASQRLPLPLVLRLTQDVAEALHYSHQHGVVHRDVKPGNIMLTEENRAKLADFGVAKIDVSNLTVSGQLFGTPAYMSPEQLLGGPIDGRSDLFSLGAVLYCMLAGYKPFQGNGASTITFKVINREPLRVTMFDTKLPAGLDRIVGRALAKEPELRYQSGAQMSADLQEIRDELSISERSDQRRFASNPRRISSVTANATPNGERTALPAKSVSTPLIDQSSRRVSKSRSTKKYLITATALVFFAAMALSVIVARERSLETSNEKHHSEVTGAAATIPTSETTPVPANPVKKANEPIAVDTTRRVGKDGTTTNVNRRSTAMPDPKTSYNVASVRGDPNVSAPAPTNRQSPISSSTPSILDVVIDNHFADALLFVWIDEKLLLQDSLRGGVKKRFVLFHTVEGENYRQIHAPAGNHRITVRVQSVISSFDGRASVTANLVGDRPTMLTVYCDGTNQVQLAVH